MTNELTDQEIKSTDAWHAQLSAEQDQEQVVFQQIEKAASAWRAKWPKYCPSCGGWGGRSYPSSAYDPGGYDVCEAHGKIEICHRCGEHGLDENGTGPCANCGWNYDDGKPQS